jgi:hypothetical protein
MTVAAAHAGINSNILADELLFDAPSGNAVLNGIPVTLSAVADQESPHRAAGATTAVVATP